VEAVAAVAAVAAMSGSSHGCGVTARVTFDDGSRAGSASSHLALPEQPRALTRARKGTAHTCMRVGCNELTRRTDGFYLRHRQQAGEGPAATSLHL
jgi:hypothetical protein